jgi:hypothetical protein
MKKLILILAVFMAFAVKSFAYSGYETYFLQEEGYYPVTIDNMYCNHVWFSIGSMNPGYVEVYGYRSDGGSTLHERVDYPEYGDFTWNYSIAGCQINIAVYTYFDEANGAIIQWD